MKISTVVDSRKTTWNKNGKHWFDGVEINMGTWDTEEHKYDYESDAEGLSKMLGRGYSKEEYDTRKKEIEDA